MFLCFVDLNLEKLLRQSGGRGKSELAQALRSRPSSAEVIGVGEGKGEPWLSFRDRRGDSRRGAGVAFGTGGVRADVEPVASRSGSEDRHGSQLGGPAIRGAIGQGKAVAQGAAACDEELESANKCATNEWEKALERRAVELACNCEWLHLLQRA